MSGKKFADGDRFYVKENGLKGQIIKMSFNSIRQENEYIVQWDGRNSHESYPQDEVESIWELDTQCPVITMRMPQAIDFIPIQIEIKDLGVVKVECNGHHQWVEVGFQFTKMVCKHCDLEKK